MLTTVCGAAEASDTGNRGKTDKPQEKNREKQCEKVASRRKQTSRDEPVKNGKEQSASEKS